MDLIQLLKEEHDQILESFETLEKDIQKGKLDFDVATHFGILKEILTKHLELENKFLYPRLGKLEYVELQELGRIFNKEMLKVSDTAFAFFDKYGEKDAVKLNKSTKFNKEFKDLVIVVKKRVRIEEDVLFPAYSKYYKE